MGAALVRTREQVREKKKKKNPEEWKNCPFDPGCSGGNSINDKGLGAQLAEGVKRWAE